MPRIQIGINVNAHPVLEGNASRRLPSPQQLNDANVDWIRLVFMYGDLKFDRYQAHYGDQSITQAVSNLNHTLNNINPIEDHRRYIESIQAVSPNTRVLVILNYQTIHPTGDRWATNDWETYVREFGRACEFIATGLRGMKAAYEIWNEGDLNAGSSVPVDPGLFGAIIVNAYESIKRADNDAEVVFGGLVGGADQAADYVNAVLDTNAVTQFRARTEPNALPFDAIGVHPYLKYAGADLPPWVDENNQKNWGRLDDTLFEYIRRFPSRVPLWVTECGIAQYTSEWWNAVAGYMQDFIEHFQNRPNDRIPVVIWFGYADGGGETAGLVDINGDEKTPIFARFFQLVGDNDKLERPDELELLYPHPTAHLSDKFRPGAQRLLFRVPAPNIDELVIASTSGTIVRASPQTDKPECVEVWLDFTSNDNPHRLIYRFLATADVAVADNIQSGQAIGTAGVVNNISGFTLSLERLDPTPMRLDPELYLIYPYDETDLGLQFVADITINDGDEIAPNIRTEKVWQLRNSGRIPWISDSRLVQIDEVVPHFPNAERLDIPTDDIIIPEVQPGIIHELTLPFTVPAGAGVYQARFQIETPQGVRFGQKPWLVFEVNVDLANERRNRRRRLERNRPDATLFSELDEFPILMLDISHHQTNVDFEAAQAAGIRAIFHKATESDSFIDSRYQECQQEVQDLGLLWGAYHFGRGTDPEAQVDHFLHHAKPDGNTLFALDIEAGMPLDVAVAFVRHFQKKTGQLPLIYTSARAYSQSITSARTPITADDIELLASCPLWVAHYTSASQPSLPEPWRDFQWAMWQFTSNEDHVLAAGAPEHRIPNFTDGPHDVNRYHGTTEQLEALWRSYTPEAQEVAIRPIISTHPVLIGDDSQPPGGGQPAGAADPVVSMYAIGTIQRNTAMFVGAGSDARERRLGNINDEGQEEPNLQAMILAGQEVLIITDTINTGENPLNRVPILFQGIRGWVSAEDILHEETATNDWLQSKVGKPSAEPDPIVMTRTPMEILEQDYRISLSDIVDPVWGTDANDEELMIVLATVRKIASRVAKFIENKGFEIDPMTAFRLMFTPLICLREPRSTRFWGLNDSRGHRILLQWKAFHWFDNEFTPGDLIAHEIAHCFTHRYQDENGRTINQIYDDAGREQIGHQFIAKADDSKYSPAALPAEYTADALANYWHDRLYDTPAGEAHRQRAEALMDIAVQDRIWRYGLADAFEQRSGIHFFPTARNHATLNELDDVIHNLREVIPLP